MYYATGDKFKAFSYSLLSGLAEPLGALLTYLVLLPFLNEVIFGIMLAATAGIMVYISLDELLPSAHECGEHRASLTGLLGGMLIISLNLLMF